MKPRKKNISFNPASGQLSGDVLVGGAHQALTAMVQRFSSYSDELLRSFLPSYLPGVVKGRTSYRVKEAKGRQAASFRKDDRRLHVDAFASSPNRGQRILRVFSNINPLSVPRVWRIGEPFSDVVTHFQRILKRPNSIKNTY